MTLQNEMLELLEALVKEGGDGCGEHCGSFAISSNTINQAKQLLQRSKNDLGSLLFKHLAEIEALIPEGEVLHDITAANSLYGQRSISQNSPTRIRLGIVDITVVTWHIDPMERQPIERHYEVFYENNKPPTLHRVMETLG